VALKAALCVMRFAYEGGVNPTRNLIDELFLRLDGSEHLTQASAWALAWIAAGVDPWISRFFGEDRSPDTKPYWPNFAFIPRLWIPMYRDILRLLSIIENSNTKQETLRFLTWIIEFNKNIPDVELVLVLLDHQSSTVRLSAIVILRGRSDKRAIDPLIARLDDAEENVREAAASALGQIKSDRAIDPLIARLDAEENVRRAAALALGQIKSDRAIGPLIARLDDADDDVRRAVASALETLRNND
jgi:hypothetical protein